LLAILVGILLGNCWIVVGTLLDTIISLGGLLISVANVPESRRLPFLTVAQNVNAFNLPIQSLNADSRCGKPKPVDTQNL
jgi:hypothetical protein